MELQPFSRSNVLESMQRFELTLDYVDPVYNYFVHGLPPGGFFTSLLANDAMGALSRSHPLNQITELKKLVSWILNVAPPESYGTYEKVNDWLASTDERKFELLKRCGLVFDPEEEILMILKGKHIPVDPVFF